MKQLILKLIILVAATLSYIQVQSQNSIWSLGPDYFKFPSSTTTPFPNPGGSGVIYNDYGGLGVNKYAMYTHNSILDVDGNLSFFIIDNMLYDANGAAIAELPGTGNSEIVIIPVPSSCSRYYIVTNKVYIPGGPSSNNSFYPYYVTLDLSIPIPDNWLTNLPGSLIDITTGAVHPDDPGIDLSQNLTPSWPPATSSISNVFMGATKLRLDNTRFLFISNGANVYRYKATNSGIFFDNYSFPLDNATTGKFRSELEIVEINGGGSTQYRIAVPYKSALGYSIKIADLDNSGDIISGTENILEIEQMPFTSGIPYIKGLEFSPNGRYLYFTHLPNSGSSSNLIRIKIFDNDANAYVAPNPSSSIVADMLLFGYSMIELAKDGKLYLINNIHMATIDNADDPANLIWNSAAISLPNTYYPNGKAPLDNNDPPPTPLENTRLHLLPDQIDGDDYMANFFSNLSCCLNNSFYEVSSANNTHEYYNSAVWDNTGNNPWGISGTTSVRVKDKLVIKTGANITINNMTFEFAPEAKLIIEQGAKLTVNGSTLTADTRCDAEAMWEGVEVVGDVNTSQMDPSLKHGRLEVINGALIENAKIAVRAHKRFANGSNDYSSTGGIVFAANSTFKNNTRDIEFLSYQNFIPTPAATHVNDLSSIRNCTFTWDETGNMFALGYNLTGRSHITMWAIHGIEIEGNEFRNDFASNSPLYQKGNGITSIDADYTVNEACNSISLPCNLVVPNLFQQLNIGVRAVGMNTISRVVIDGNTFNENRFGVVLEAATYPSVTRNTFNLPMSTVTIEDGGDAIGIYSIGSYGFNLEENTFKTTSFFLGLGSNYGIVTDNSSLNGGLIYKNTYNNVIVGVLNSNDNSVLEIDCNAHNAGFLRQYDWAISSGSLDNQGSCVFNGLPAKNLFNSNCSGEENIFISNNALSGLVYSSYPLDAPACVSNSVLLFNCNISPINQCSSNISNPLTGTQLLAAIDAIKTTITTQLATLFDGGDTDNLISIIDNQSSGQVKNTLMNASPYLSDKVLNYYLTQTPPPGHVKEVIVANSPVSADIMKAIDNMNLPNGIRNQINSVQSGISERELLENQIRQLRKEIQLLKNELIRYYLDLQLYPDVRNKLNDDQTTADKAALLQLLAKTEPATADQLITELRADATELRIENPTNEKANDIDHICDFFTCIKNKAAASGNFNELTTTEEQTMRTLSITSGPAAINAQNALDFFVGEIFERRAEPIVVTTNNNRVMQPKSNNYSSSSQYELNNYPNPFNENTVIEVTLPTGYVGKIVINDVMGREIKRYHITESENKIEISGNEIGYGIFFYSLYVNGEFVETKKMTRTKLG